MHLLLGLLWAIRVAGDAPVDELARYNTVLGTQAIGGAYQFTGDPMLWETAQVNQQLGAAVIKFKIGRDYHGKPNANVPAADPRVSDLTTLVRDEPTHRAVFDLPFANYVLWAYTFGGGWWDRGYSDEAQAREYREIHDLAVHLLRTYNGTGKSFYLGHWEGDWHLRRGYDTKSDDSITPAAVAGMVAWLNTRQRAIDDAKREVPHQDVAVWGYCEVNLVKLAMAGRRTVTNDVLPQTSIDFVSYSAYDAGLDPAPCLDYLAGKLPPKDGVPGRRVFIGEYGFPAERHSPAEQDARSRTFLRAALAWGVPFCLYWELYNNELQDGRQRGFWMIDDQNQRQPIYFTHQRFYAWAREWVRQFRQQHGRLPSTPEFGAAGAAWLAGP
ncbi:MAG: hypothetical protein IT204_24065 [Fimbriimonadaceae bacterium]|nr:hypothetical protein [Fimbriimonadaceae bacterium]